MRKLPFLPDCRLPSSDQVQWKQPACCASPNNWATPSDSSQANSNGRGTPWVSGRDASSNDASASSVDRKSVVSGKSVSVRVDLGGRRIIKNKIFYTTTHLTTHTQISQ